MVPPAAPTVLALMIALGAALVGGRSACWLADVFTRFEQPA
jgi:hypothetical protein